MRGLFVALVWFGGFTFGAWAGISTSGDLRLKDCEQIGKTRLDGVAVECRVIKP